MTPYDFQVDPTLTRADRLVGQVLGQVGELPDVYSELEINFFLLRRLLGVRSKEGEKQGKVSENASLQQITCSVQDHEFASNLYHLILTGHQDGQGRSSDA